MPPPVEKKRKTAAAGSIPVGTRRATSQSHQPGLSIEMVAKVASFANYDGGDVMNICLAVGPTDAAVVRYTCLRNNMNFLQYTLENLGAKKGNRTKKCIAAWVAINTDWRKLCTKERTEDDQLSTASYENEEGEIVSRTDPFILFNNPVVAIELNMVDVLKHLVEVVGIDVNAYKWNGLIAVKKYHLLFTAMGVAEAAKNWSCFNYLTSLRDINALLKPTQISNIPLWCCAYDDSRCSKKTFRAIVGHPSFDANRPFEVRGRVVAPLLYAFKSTLCDQNPGKSQKMRGRFQALLDVGADPGLSTDTTPSPLDMAKILLRSVISHNRDESFNVEEGRKLIQLMEEKVAGGASR